MSKPGKKRRGAGAGTGESDGAENDSVAPASSSSSSLLPRAKIAKVEQIPFLKTLELRREFLGPSCKLFYKSNPLKIVRAKGGISIWSSFYIP